MAVGHPVICQSQESPFFGRGRSRTWPFGRPGSAVLIGLCGAVGSLDLLGQPLRFLLGSLGFESRPCTCYVGALLLEPHHQFFLLQLFWSWGLTFCPGCDPPAMLLAVAGMTGVCLHTQLASVETGSPFVCPAELEWRQEPLVPGQPLHLHSSCCCFLPSFPEVFVAHRSCRAGGSTPAVRRARTA
jgi:hypothetical protein